MSTLQAAQRRPVAGAEALLEPLLGALSPLSVTVARMRRHFVRFGMYFNSLARHFNLTLRHGASCSICVGVGGAPEG
jgi:hypothetical protein